MSKPRAKSHGRKLLRTSDYACQYLTHDAPVHRLGAGRFILNTLAIRENLGRHPAAERLLRNMLAIAGAGAGEPLAEAPAEQCLAVRPRGRGRAMNGADAPCSQTTSDAGGHGAESVVRPCAHEHGGHANAEFRNRSEVGGGLPC